MSLSTISARIETEDKVAFDDFCNKVGLNTSSVLNMFVKKVISEGKIPFEISLPKKVSREEALAAFNALREEAEENNLQDLSLDEINAEIALMREERK